MSNKNKLEKKVSKHREKQKTETRDLILLSARNLFDKLGFAGTTMRAVAGEAEMGGISGTPFTSTQLIFLL